MRALAVAQALLLCGTQLAAFAHQAAVPHRTCEHGQVVHDGESAPLEPGRVAASRLGAEHEHGCALLFFAHAPAAASASGVAAPALPDGSVAHLAAREVPRAAPLAFAPSRSPPPFAYP